MILLSVVMLTMVVSSGRLIAANDNNDALEAAQQEGASLATVPLPAQVERALDQIIAFMQAPTGAVTLGTWRPLQAFMRAEAGTGRAWQPQDRWGADGAASLITLPSVFSNHIALYYGADIPDAALFPSSLRYGAIIDTAAAARSVATCVNAAVPLNRYAAERFRGIEETTPNMQSGTAYHYTNVRTLVQINLAGRPLFVSYSQLLGRSSYAIRGIHVGPMDDALFYYSEKPGTNLTGLNWVQPIMYVSYSLVFNMPLDDRHIASCAFSWVSAGWRGLNVTRTYHIIPILRTIQQKMLVLARTPQANYAHFSALANDVMRLSPAEVNARYQGYCAYVKVWRDKENKGLTSLVKRRILTDLYNEDTLARLDDAHRRALLMQEDVRALLGKPTWSAPQQ